jgi:hypothetical protein
MVDLSPYISLLVSVIAVVLYAVIAWQISGEAFDEKKFTRTLLLGFLMALGFNVSGTALGNVYVSPFASTLIASLLSKYINITQAS